MINHNTRIKVYGRKNGMIGVRNHLAVISTVFCANHVAESIVRQVPEAVAITHHFGCGQLGKDAKQTLKVLTNIGKHPNVGAILIVGLGCEQINAHDLAIEIACTQKPVKTFIIQDEGGTSATIEKGVACCRQLIKGMQDDVDRISASCSELVVGLECGGSDFTSGIASNPAVGIVADLFTDVGARVIFGETAEALGAEHILAERAVNKKVKAFILNKVAATEKAAEDMHVDMRGSQPSPGNIAGGLSTIAEKSLGAICKSGNRPIVDVLEYAEPAGKAGLSFMDCPGQDLVSICGIVAGGAHLVLFTTGRGTPLGFAIAPVLKISANSEAVRKMAENIDMDLSDVLTGDMSLDDAGRIMVAKVLEVAEGKLTKAEKLGHREFGFHSIGPTL
jgi:altronate dehydratase large subunit